MARPPPWSSSAFLGLLCIITFPWRLAVGSTLCDGFGDSYRLNIQQNLDHVFDADKLNLVIQLDVSKSIGSSLYRSEVERFAFDLIEFGVRKKGMTIDSDHAWIHIYTFRDVATSQLPSLNHACEIYDRLKEIDPGTFEGRTEVHLALNTTRQVLIDRQRRGDNKVLFLVTDGDFTSSKEDVEVAVAQLRTLDVDIFAVVVGNSDKERIQQNINMVVRNVSHILCYKGWKEMIKWARKTNMEENTWANVTAAQLVNSCPVCSNHSRCMCEVNKQRYSCRCDPGRYLNENGDCQVCPDQCVEGDNCVSVCSDEVQSAGLSPVFVIIIALTALVLILLIAIMMLVACKRHKNKQTNFNNVFFGSTRNIVIVQGQASENRESNDHTTDRTDPESRSNPCTPDSQVQTSTVQTIVAKIESRDIVSANQKPASTPETSDTENTYHALNEPSSSRSSHVYVTLTPDLPDATRVPPDEPNQFKCTTKLVDASSADLDRLIADSDIEGAAVISKEDKAMAVAGNLHIRSLDVIHLLKLLRSDEWKDDHCVFPIGDRMYQVKVQKSSTSALYAEETTEKANKSAIWIIDSKRHLVIAVGNARTAAKCEQALKTLKRVVKK